MTRTVAIVQARMGGTRLPGKVMADIEGQPLIVRQMDRMKRAQALDEIVVAVPCGSPSWPDAVGDKELAEFCTAHGWTCWAGPEDDVLRRYAEAAKWHEADPIVRMTMDCPLIDWGIIDGCVRLYRESGADYVSNNLERTFPHGTDVEVFSAQALRDAHEQSVDPFEREHVTEWIRRHQDRPYHMVNLCYPIETVEPETAALLLAARLTVDYEEDLTLVRAIYRAYPDKDYISISDVMALLAAQPELMKINEQRALDHAQHLSGHFEPISAEQRLRQRQAVAAAMARAKA